MIPIAKYDKSGHCIKAGYSPKKAVKQATQRLKKALTPSKKTQNRVEWTVAGITILLGTVVAVEILAAIAAIVM